MGVDAHMVSWITDYLTGRPQFVRLKDGLSDTVISSTGAPQGTVLSPVLFTLYTSDFRYNKESCHLQKFSDDTAIVGCIRDGQEGEYRSLVEDFVQWCKLNHLQLNTTKTKEMVVDFQRTKRAPLPVSIEGVNVEVVSTYKYLGVQERTEPAVLPEEAKVLQCLQQTPRVVLPVCGRQRPLLCSGVLGRKH